VENLPNGTFALATVRFRAVAPAPGAAVNFAVGDPLRQTDITHAGESVYGGGEAATVVVN
jgi:hypothetical protein